MRSLTDIKHGVDPKDIRLFLDTLLIHLAKIESLFVVVNTDDFFDINEITLRNYFSTAEELAVNALLTTKNFQNSLYPDEK